MSQPTDILLTQRFLPEHGGSIRWMYEAYRRWPRPVHVITHAYAAWSPSAGANGDPAADPNFTLERLDIFLSNWGLDRPSRWQRYLRMTAAVGRQLRRLPAGGRLIVHAVHAVPEVVSLIPLKKIWGDRLAIVCYAHGEEVTACCSSRQLRFLMRRAHAIVDLMLANSRYTAEVIAPHIDPAKVRVVNPGVDLASFAAAAEMGARWRAEQGYGQRLIVLTVGRLDPRKNQAAVIEAVARLAGRFPQLLYVVAGEGQTQAALRELAQRRGVGDKVVFTGSVDSELKLALFGGCDLFAMPAVRHGTDVEGFGMVFLEAAACGKPSLAGCTGGQSDAVIDGRTGLIVDGGNLEAVTAALERMVADAAFRKLLGEQARAQAQRFDWPAVVQRTVQLVEELN